MWILSPLLECDVMKTLNERISLFLLVSFSLPQVFGVCCLNEPYHSDDLDDPYFDLVAGNHSPKKGRKSNLEKIWEKYVCMFKMYYQLR